MEIREITVEDAENFLNLCKKLDKETKFLLFEPGERNISVEEQRNHIEKVLESDKQTILVVEESDELVGFIEAFGRPYKRKRHCVYIVIGVFQQYTNQGIGTKLLASIEQWASKQKIHRLELCVMVHNQAGLGLYKKMGFEIEGRLNDSLLVDGNYVDEYIMAKILSTKA